jgi:hypothetical protein
VGNSIFLDEGINLEKSMKNNYFSIKRLHLKVLLVFSAIFSATLLNLTKTLAQSTTVNFTGNVANTCVIGTVVNGALILDEGRKTMSTSTLGTMNITCNGSIKIDIIDFSQQSGPSIFAGTAKINDPIASAMVTASFSNYGSATGTGTGVYPVSGNIIDDEQFTVDVSLDNASNKIEAGDYQFAVSITVNPQ